MRKTHWVPTVAAVVPLALSPLVPAFAALQPAQPVTVAAPADASGTDRIIVRYEGSPATSRRQGVLEHAAAAAGVPAAAHTDELKTIAGGAVVVSLATRIPMSEAHRLAAEISADPSVSWAQPDRPAVIAKANPSDPGYRHQWSMQQLQVPTAWNAATGAGTVVGIVDTGITAHPDLDSHIVGGYDFIDDIGVAADHDGRDADYSDPGDHQIPGACSTTGEDWDGYSSWHGTHVAGIAAAAANNAHAGAGVAPEAQLLIARSLGACGTGWESDIIDALTWMSGGSVPGVPDAPARADVVNLSLSMGGECNRFLQEAITAAVSRGTTVVAAAGNNGQPASRYALASCDHVIAVGATTTVNQRTTFSNYGPAVDVWAPGESIYSTYNTGTRTPGHATSGYMSGTSMAAPFVAGLVALLRQHDPTLTPAQIEARLESTAGLTAITTTPGVADPGSRGRRVDPVRALGAAPTSSPFTDVRPGQIFYNEMIWVAEQGISRGWTGPNGTRTYRPATPVNRDIMAAFLYRAAGSPAYTAPSSSPFMDVPTGHVFYKEIAWMRATGVSHGWTAADGTRTYRPDQAVTRAQMAAFLYRAAGSPAYTAPAKSPFTDVSVRQDFYKEIAWMRTTGISNGWTAADGTRTYQPESSIYRDAMAAFLFRLDGTA